MISYLVTTACLVCLVVGCATTTTTTTPTHIYTEEEQAFYHKMMAQPNPFMLPKSQSEDAWGRANVFVSQYSVMRVQSATNYTITTYYDHDQESGNFGYEITRTPLGDSDQFAVLCVGYGGEEAAHQNARAAAYFIVTGKVNPIFITP